jgi:hypothetical protein
MTCRAKCSVRNRARNENGGVKGGTAKALPAPLAAQWRSVGCVAFGSLFLKVTAPGSAEGSKQVEYASHFSSATTGT